MSEVTPISNTLVMSEKMKAGAQTRMAAMQTAQAILQSYVMGCRDALGLEGEWNLDTATWTFSKMEPKEAVK